MHARLLLLAVALAGCAGSPATPAEPLVEDICSRPWAIATNEIVRQPTGNGTRIVHEVQTATPNDARALAEIAYEITWGPDAGNASKGVGFLDKLVTEGSGPWRYRDAPREGYAS